MLRPAREANHPRRGFVTLLAMGLAASSLLAYGSSAGAADWPSFLNGNQRIGATTDNLKLPLKKAWEYAPPSTINRAWSGPTGRTIEGKVLRDRIRFDDAFQVASVGEQVFFGSSVDHQVYCKNVKTGKTEWAFYTGGPVRLAPTVFKGKVFFGSDDGFVYCVAADSGKLVWKLRGGPADEWLIARGEMISRWPCRTGVMIEGGVAYFGVGVFPHEDIFLYAVNPDDGKIIWKRDDISESDAGRSDLTPQGYLLAENDLLVVPSGRTLPAALDRNTGKFLHKRAPGWRGEAGGVVGGTRAMLADGQIYAAGAHHMLAMSQKDGSVGFGYFDGHQLAVSGDSAYTATGVNVGRLDRAAYAAASIRRHKLKGTISSLQRSARSAKGKALADIRAKIEAADKELETLDEVGYVWKQPCEADAALIVAGDLVFVGGEKEVVAFRTEDGKQVWNAEVEGETRGLAAANGRLFASTTTGNVYTFATDSAASDATTALNQNPYPADKLSKTYADAAEQILKNANSKSGYCLVLGSERGRLAYELAKRSNLKIYGIEPDAEKVAESRRLLSSAGLYGHRVTIHQADFADIPYANYFANLIVSDTLLVTDKLPGKPSEIARHLKPMGGVMLFGHPGNAAARLAAAAWVSQFGLDEQSTLKNADGWVMVTRNALPGAGNWSHQYGDSGNTASSPDTRIKGGLGVLWYGDPGPGKMVNRHEGAVGPIAVDGKLFVQGESSVLAYDAYNGQKLWEYGNPDSLRTGVFQNQNPGNLVAGGGNLFVLMKDSCLELDGDTGKLVREHKLPDAKGKESYEWGYVAFRDGVLYGTATLRKELEQRLRRRGRKTDDITDGIFAIDTKTGKHLWTHEGKNIVHHTIALGPGKVYFIDSTITEEQRADLLREDKTELAKLTGEEAKRAEARLKRIDARRAVAIDAKTGNIEWSKAVDVTDCSDVGIGGGKLTLMQKNGVLVLSGANANGHYWKQFIAGEFKQRRIVSLASDDGHKLWARDANYRHRPIIIGSQIIAEPWSFDLYTGEQLTRENPFTGQQEPWSIMRPGHHCGMLTGCDSMLLFRSRYTGFYDLDSDSGTRHFAGHRLGCWINAIPANGLVMIPEASAGCVCLFSIASTITLEPRAPRRPWTLYSSTGRATPVKKMALNLGAPGDRKDARGQVWLSYPRIDPHKTTGLDLTLNLGHKFHTGGEHDSMRSSTANVADTESPWLYSSWAVGLSSYTFPLLGKDDKPATYTLRLHFADLSEKAAAGTRVFDVKAQGETVIKDLDVAGEAGGARKALVREVKGIQVSSTLLLELTPRAANASRDALPTLNAVEVIREGD
ncbi:MAG: PQQ-binding-like beta-propeller repeat protein [Planctomycetaceae bacterium]|jgi:outer membrane protein assembly factor BamB|nr:PQQ-binding-like beta-propeller repeat protein [Planctomycetaceae bacterium]MBT6484075.1 PQQ-binding-like beta-propeller repeat protein [Planctomycetaceae bacterium]